MKTFFLVFLFILIFGCQGKKNSPTEQDWITALVAIHYNVQDECIREYGSISPLGVHYATNLFSGYPLTCENAIIGNSTMDIGRQVSGFYDPGKTNNYGIGGNTACDMFLQMDFIQCHPRNVIIASSDGNGILRGVSAEVSKKTIQKIINKAKAKWNPKIILVGVHPIKLSDANRRKNDVNRLVKELPDCFIDMVQLFGIGENDLPPDSFMADQIHYKEPIYTRLKNKILSQCGVDL